LLQGVYSSEIKIFIYRAILSRSKNSFTSQQPYAAVDRAVSERIFCHAWLHYFVSQTSNRKQRLISTAWPAGYLHCPYWSAAKIQIHFNAF